ncbi:MAG: hypothetical protein AAF420_11625 [Pseudomonadota bacterium]
MVEKRARKMESAKKDLPKALHFGDESSKVGIMGIGMNAGVIREALGRVAEHGVNLHFFQMRTLWPMLDETLEFIEKCEKVYVVEHNATGQLASILRSCGADKEKLISILRIDCTPMRPGELVGDILEHEGIKLEEVDAA